MTDLEEMLTVSEVASHLRISKKQAYRLTSQQDFPAVRIGRRILIPKEQYMNWVNKHRWHT